MTVASPAPPALPAPLVGEIESRFGAVRQAVAAGSRVGTWIVVAGGRRLVAKELRDGRTEAETRRLFTLLDEEKVPHAPLLDVAAGRWALFAWVPGAPPAPGDGWDAVWETAFALLARLRELRAELPGDPGARWLARVSESAASHPASAAVLAEVAATRCTAPRSLAHGDFAPQNLLVSPLSTVLVDWEEAGTADDGFDAGWLLALNRLGAGPRLPRALLMEKLASLGFTADALRRHEGLGLLRMHHRAAGWAAERPALLTSVRRALQAYADEG